MRMRRFDDPERPPFCPDCPPSFARELVCSEVSV
jgi:hypothetical protein